MLLDQDTMTATCRNYVKHREYGMGIHAIQNEQVIFGLIFNEQIFKGKGGGMINSQDITHTSLH